MPVTLTFHTFAEKKPEHGQQIMYFEYFTSFDSYGYEFKSAEVEYQWDILYKGDYTGSSICYEPDDIELKVEDHVELLDGESYSDYSIELRILIDGYHMDNEYIWMTADEYFESLPKH